MSSKGWEVQKEERGRRKEESLSREWSESKVAIFALMKSKCLTG